MNFVPSWLATDQDTLDIGLRKLCYWKPNSLRAFVAEHVWENLTEKDAMQASAICIVCY